MHGSTSTQRERHYNDPSYTIPYQLLRDNTRNKAVVHAFTGKRELGMTAIQRRQKRAKRSKKEKKKRKETKEKRNKKLHACAEGAGRVQRSRGDKVAVGWHNQSYYISR